MLGKPKVKYIQNVGQKKFREQEGLFIAEGPRLVEELIASPGTVITGIFAVPEWAEEHKDQCGSIPVTIIDQKELEKISQLRTPNQVLALVRQFAFGQPMPAAGRISLVLDTIRDPGNFGTILRIADWFGIHQVLASPDCADMYNPKVVQATMGSIARVKVFYLDIEDWLAGQENTRVYAAVLGGNDISTMKKIKEGIIIIGNEAKGISDALLKHPHEKITIRRIGQAESLNAAVATGIILSHLTPG